MTSPFEWPFMSDSLGVILYERPFKSNPSIYGRLFRWVVAEATQVDQSDREPLVISGSLPANEYRQCPCNASGKGAQLLTDSEIFIICLV